ncbi:hypothetical protein BH09SUM1_BH09SUM1_06340 [soil metagenome]
MQPPWVLRLPPGSLVLAAVSGGADSVYLLHHLLEQLSGADHPVAVCHINHGLRGADSDADAAFVSDLCVRLGVTCHSQRVKPELMHGRKKPDENTMREARLGLLKALATQLDAGAIAFGHQQDDVAETFLLQALRGSGPQGLEGMRGVRELRGGLLMVRPLLDLSRAEIRKRLRDRGELWREDPSNEEPVFRRNRLRADVIPILREIEPAAVSMLAESAAFSGQVNDFYRKESRKALAEITLCSRGASTLISTEKFRADTTPLLHAGVLRELLGDLLDDSDALPPPRAVVRHAVFRMEKEAGDAAEFTFPNARLWVANRYAIGWRNGKLEDALYECRAGFPFILSRTSSEVDIPRERGKTVFDEWVIDLFVGENSAAPKAGVSFDLAKITKPLRLAPLDINAKLNCGDGTKIVRDVLREAGVPIPLRDVVIGLHDANRLLWIPGIRQDAETLVGADSTKALQIDFHCRKQLPGSQG